MEDALLIIISTNPSNNSFLLGHTMVLKTLAMFTLPFFSAIITFKNALCTEGLMKSLIACANKGIMPSQYSRMEERNIVNHFFPLQSGLMR